MRVTSKITVNLRKPNTGARVDAVQNDVNTRAVEISIFDGDDAWPVPEGVTAAVGFRKPDYKRGLYDKLPDGSAATQINGSVITVILAQQMLTAPGRVDACIILNDADLNQLTSFPFYVYVEASPAYGAQQSDDYIRLEWLEQKLDEYLQQIGGGSGTVDKTTVQKIVDEYLTENPPTVTERDPTVPDWAKQPQKPSYTALEVGADPAGTAASAASQHNTDTAAHNDLRITLQDLTARVNAVLDSDDATLDQMSEVVAYIKSNKTLIDAITTSKVSVDDIINDLVTNVADKPLSAAQGVVLKGLIEELRTLIPEAYTLPTATETTLGGVKPVTATDAMTQPVGVTEDGRLVTKPGDGASGIAVTGATVGQTIRVAAVDDDGVPTAWEAVDFPSAAGAGEWFEQEYDFSAEYVAGVKMELPSANIVEALLVITASNDTGGPYTWRIYGDVIASSANAENLMVSSGGGLYTGTRTANVHWSISDGLNDMVWVTAMSFNGSTVACTSPHVKRPKEFIWFFCTQPGVNVTGNAKLYYKVM